jgi:hypothetical protein
MEAASELLQRMVGIPPCLDLLQQVEVVGVVKLHPAQPETMVVQAVVVVAVLPHMEVELELLVKEIMEERERLVALTLLAAGVEAQEAQGQAQLAQTHRGEEVAFRPLFLALR